MNGLFPIFFLTSRSLTHFLHPNIFSALSLPASNSPHFSRYHFSISFTLSDKSPFALTSQSDSITANRHRPSDQYKEQHIQEQTNILAHTHTHTHVLLYSQSGFFSKMKQHHILESRPLAAGHVLIFLLKKRFSLENVCSLITGFVSFRPSFKP